MGTTQRCVKVLAIAVTVLQAGPMSPGGISDCVPGLSEVMQSHPEPEMEDTEVSRNNCEPVTKALIQDHVTMGSLQWPKL